MPITRRNFALSAGAAGIAVITGKKALSFAGETEKVQIDANSSIGTIRPEFHGQFAEHLGSCIYGGLWVGKGSQIPNINGYRKAAVDYLAALKLPVLRWPGGCFADDYHWRDGIGPVAKRPKNVNLHWGLYTEDNSFGTHEFIGLCKLIGSEPYLAGNIGTGTPKELRDWMEYCNYPSGSTLSDERAANGSPKPFNVKYWGVGNENWGCGGNMKPGEYAEHYRRFVTFLRTFRDPQPFFIACGPNRNDAEWTRGFFENLKRVPVHGYAMHFYSNSRLLPVEFNASAAKEQFATFQNLEKAILDQRAIMDQFDPKRQIGLLIDEWGVWDRMDPAEEKQKGRLWMQITMRSAVAAALGLNIFNRHADKLVMCNIAQIVNVLHSLLLTEEDQTVRTSTYYVYDLMKAHRGQTAVKAGRESRAQDALSISASRSGNSLVITAVNQKLDSTLNVDCAITGAKASGGSARVLHHADLNAFNSFSKPDTIVPKPLPVQAEGSRVRLELPPLSVVTATVQLA